MQINDKTFSLYLDQSTIQKRVKGIAQEIDADFRTTTQPTVFLVVLKGAAPFAIDIAKHITARLKFEYIKISSYNRGTTSTGKVSMSKDDWHHLKDQDIVIIEDIIDSGLSVSKLKNMLSELGCASIKTCCLLYKPTADQHDTKIDYCGFEIPHKFVVGYGMDYQEIGRELQDIYQLK